jgi:hypothetical protein
LSNGKTVMAGADILSGTIRGSGWAVQNARQRQKTSGTYRQFGSKDQNELLTQRVCLLPFPLF